MLSKAQMAKRKGVTRQAVGAACRPGGPLHDALVDGGRRVDPYHPAARIWLGEPAPDQTPVRPRSNVVSFRELFEISGCTLEEFQAALEGPLADAIIPAWHVSVDVFGALAGAHWSEALSHVAHTSAGLVDLSSDAALAYLRERHAAEPDYDAIGALPEGFLVAACDGDDSIDIDHPLAVALGVRLRGRPFEASDLDEETSP